VIDSALLDQERILCPAGDRRHSVLVAPGDIVRVTAAKTADISPD
jgi:Cys-tRNA(Pro)/Cys-tRNA(Cys) deacylase